MKATHRQNERGFSLIELMVVLLIVTLISGAIFRQIDTVQQRATREQNNLDLFQESREFMDQLTRDLHQAGYPNPHNFVAGQISGPNDMKTAIGLVKLSYNELWFEGDVDGTGVVSSVQYHLDSTGDNCPCLRRSQIPKITADPLTGQNTAAFQTEVQNVQNGTTTAPIFRAFTTDNTEVSLTSPIDIAGSPNVIANINQIKVELTAQSKYTDAKTGIRPSITLLSTVRLNNCSQAASGQTMSCQ